MQSSRYTRPNAASCWDLQFAHYRQNEQKSMVNCEIVYVSMKHVDGNREQSLEKPRDMMVSLRPLFLCPFSIY